MKAILVVAPGGPEALQLQELPTPGQKPGEVLVEVRAAGVNFIDTYQRSGAYPVPLPYSPGLEGSGVVTSIGEGVNDLVIGQRVAWAQIGGSYAEMVAVEAARAVPVPDEVPDDVAAGLLLQGITAHYLSRSTRPISEGDVVLVHAGAGGVGLLLTQLAKARGARVITTVSTDEKEALSRQAGADDVLRYDDFTDEVQRLTSGAGVDVVYDGVGASTFEGSLAALRPRGMLVLYGQSSGAVPRFDLARLAGAGSLYVTRPTIGHYLQTREELLMRTDALFAGVSDSSLSLRIGGRYPLAQAAQAHRDLESRATTGKLLLLP